MEMDASEAAQPENYSEIDKILDFLSSNNEIIFKHQQMGEKSLEKSEKTEIAKKLYDNSKLNFLIRFGKYLKENQLFYFKQFTQNLEDSYEIDLVLKDLQVQNTKREKCVKNRRYKALENMIKEEEYFSEIEMMKRNPLLYEQLVGQYLSLEEKRERDKYQMNEQTSFVKILMEGIERDNAALTKKKQEVFEDNAMEEEDTSDSSHSDDDDMKSETSQPCTSRWGEYDSEPKIIHHKPRPKNHLISFKERKLLHEEFNSIMYQNFLDGKDEDFDYETVDNNCSYDDIEQINIDEEDKYFDSEEPDDGTKKCESSEDELDIYMNALNQHPSVLKLSKSLNKL